MIFDQLERFGDNTAVIDCAEKRWSFIDLVDQSDKIADYMDSRTLMFILSKNHIQVVAAYVGALRKGVVPLLLSADIQIELLNNLVDIYKPQYIWGEKNSVELAGNIIFSNDEYQLLQTEFQPFDIHENLAVLLSTSGTTGSPKLVRQSVKNIESNTTAIINYLKLTPKDRAITTLPLYYTYGLSILQTQLVSGGSIVLTEASIFERKFWDLLKKYEVTNFGGVPYTYEMLKRLRFSRMEIPSLRFITQAGGKLSPDISADFARVCAQKGIAYITMYGASEATARMSYLPADKAEEKAGSIGIAIPGGRFELEDVEGNIVTSFGDNGELVYYGDNVTMGYAVCREDLLKGDENKGILHTGDIAFKDEDGYFYITGRKKRFLKIFGNRVSLDSVEDYLKSKGYLSCACAGVDDKLTVYSEDKIDAKEVCGLLSEYTHIHSSAFSVKFVSEIPRNNAGKILYEKLKDMKL